MATTTKTTMITTTTKTTTTRMTTTTQLSVFCFVTAEIRQDESDHGLGPRARLWTCQV